MVLRFSHNSFSKGEIDPTLYSRSDLQSIFTQGARKMRNLISLWTGAARIAAGTDSIDMVVDRTNSNDPITDYTEVIGVDFQYDLDNDITYTMIFRPDKTDTVAIDIYYNDTLQTSVGASAYTVAQIKNLHFIPGQDRLIILHEDVQTRQLIRGGSHSSWTLSAFTFSTKPTFDFTILGGTQYRTSGFTFTPGATSGTSVSLTASSAIFTANHVGGLFIGNGGRARITGVTSTTVATIRIFEDFASASAIRGFDSQLEEVLWTSGGGSPSGDDRGWPSRGTYFFNRLILGRSSTVKNSGAASTAGVFDDFDTLDVTAQASFSFTISGKNSQSIQQIISDDSLIFTTTNQLHAQNPFDETPLTKDNFYPSPQSIDPASTIEGVSLDNQFLHVTRNNTQIASIAYSTADGKYKSLSATKLSSHLIGTINSNATWEPANIQARLYFATQADGTMLMYNSLQEELIQAWTLRTTRGKFRQVIGDQNQSHVIVERQINIGSSYESAIDYGYLSDSTFGAAYDITSSLSSSTDDITLFESQYDYFVLGNDIPFTGLNFTLNTNASASIDPTFEYLNENGNWESFSVTDGTSGFTGNGEITWAFSDVSNWGPGTFNDIESKYWIRIRRQEETIATLPVEDSLTINTGVRIFLEKQNFDKYTDATITTSSNSSGAITGLTKLAGHQVYAINDGATTGPYFVDASGNTNVVNEYSSVQIGIKYDPKLIPMPVFIPTAEGDNLYTQRYLNDLFIDYTSSLYLEVNGKVVPNLTLGNYTLGQSVAPRDGVYKINPCLEWDPRQEVIVTQSAPGPMTVRGIGYNVEVT